MTTEEMMVQVTMRDKLINELILTSIMNVGKDIDLNSKGAWKEAAKRARDPGAALWLADARATFEESKFLDEGDVKAFMESLKSRRPELIRKQKEFANSLRAEFLKKM